MQLLTVLALAIALLAVLFALQNPGVVTVNFFIWQFQDPLALIILLTLVAGVVVGVMASFPAIVRRSWKIGNYKKQLEDLGWQLQDKEKEVESQKQQVDVVRSKHQEMLMVMGATEPKTGLLKTDSTMSEITYLLQQRKNQPLQAGSVCVYLIEAGAETPQDQSVEEFAWKAIAQRLQTNAIPGSWLHHNSQGRFTCITSGLDSKTASDFGEKLRTALTDAPVPLEGGVPVPVMVSIGGAIALPNEHLDSHSLLQQAEAALDHARKRGRNRFRLVEAKG